jgi:hypothetical protein
VFCLSLGKGSFNFLDGVCYLFNWLVAGTAKEKHTQKSKKKKNFVNIQIFNPKFSALGLT